MRTKAKCIPVVPRSLFYMLLYNLYSMGGEFHR